MTKGSINIDDEGVSSATVVHNGELLEFSETHPNFRRIVDAIVKGDDPSPFFDIESAFVNLSERVTHKDGVLYLDEEPLHDVVAQTVLRYVGQGRDTSAIVAFLERVEDNPSFHARKQLWGWVERQGLTVTPEGRIVGYKAIAEDGKSIHAGGVAYVDGVKVEGRIPNTVGSVIEVDRRDVNDDHATACSYGLHIGTHEYASSFGPVLLEVEFDPADVVSVPPNETSKLRTCRYKVLAVHTAPEDDLEQYETPAGWDDEDFEEIEALVPPSFLSKLRKVFGRKNKG